MSGMFIRPAKALQGKIALPGDKSISHRAALLSAMAVGVTRIDNFATSADCASTLECLKRLGVEVGRDGTTVTIRGSGKTGFHQADGHLDCGNSGTTMRLLTGILAGQGFESVLTGDDSLRSRPMQRVIRPLTAMGAAIDSESGRAPLTVHGSTTLRAMAYRPEVASAQIKSCVLLAGLNAQGETSVFEAVATRDHTERMLRWLGVDVRETRADDATKISVSGESVLTAKNLTVPADISAGAFFMVAAACLPGSHIAIQNVGLNPTRSAIIDLLSRNFGAAIEVSEQHELNNEPVGTMIVRGGLMPQQSNQIKGRMVSDLIDEIPVLAVFGTQLEGGLEVRDAAELRVKESDRIATVVENLKRMGADVEEYEDGFLVRKSRLRGAGVDSFGDHRIAMAFAIAGLLAEGETEIAGADCAAVSFPGFFEVLQDAIVYQ